MKKLTLSFLIAINSLVLFSQDIALNYEIGHNVQFGQPQGLEYVINRYNETRNYLTNEFEPFNNLDGLTMSLGGALGHWGYMDAGVNIRSRKRFATGNINGNKYERQLKYSSKAIFISLGASIPLEDNFSIVIGARGEASFGNFKTRVAYFDDIKDEEWNQIESGTYPYLTLFTKFIYEFIGIEPYFAFGSKTSFNLKYLNEDLNPNTASNDPDEIPFFHRGFGLRITFSTLNLARVDQEEYKRKYD